MAEILELTIKTRRINSKKLQFARLAAYINTASNVVMYVVEYDDDDTDIWKTHKRSPIYKEANKAFMELLKHKATKKVKITTSKK